MIDKEQAYNKYLKIEKQAYSKYLKTKEQAWDEYEKTKKQALDEYNEIKNEKIMKKEIDDILDKIGYAINNLEQIESEAGNMGDKAERNEAYNQRMSFEKAYDIIEDIRNVRIV